MIPAKLVRQYLAQEKDDHRWLKELTVKEVDAALAMLRPRPRFVTDLWLHQKVCFLLGVAFPQFCFWVDMAGGKTVISLELINYWRMAGKITTGAMAMSLDAERLYSWERDIKDRGFKFNWAMLDSGSTKTNWEIIEENQPELILCPYPSLSAMLSKLTKVKGKKKRELKPVPEWADVLAQYVDAMFWDESTKAGHLSSVVHRTCRLMRNRVDIRYGLAGVPFGRDPVLLRNQMNLVDGGETFGPNLDLFREAFFSKKKNHFGGKYSFIYKFKKEMKGKLSQMLQHRSITYATEEFTDRPKVHRRVSYVNFGEDAEKYYNRFLLKLRKARGNYEEGQNAFIRMRQIASGFVGMKDDETGDKVEVEFANNPKLDRLMEKIDRIPPGRKFLIIYEFTYSGRAIHAALKARGIRHGWLWSGTKDPLKLQRLYDDDPEFMGLVANWRKSAFGLNAQKGNYQFIYESPVAVIERRQVDRRMDRPGQLFDVHLTDIAMKPIDDKILEFHREGGDLFKSLMGSTANTRAEPKASKAKNTRKKA